MSDKTKLTWVKGSVVKQGDTSSVFKLKLKTDEGVALNGPATVQLIDENQSKLEFEAEVVENLVQFNLSKVLPVGDYIVEVEHAGYVFPSTDSVILTVNENLGDYITEDVAEFLDIKGYISKALNDYQANQIDLDELVSKLNLPKYDDSELRAEIDALKHHIETLETGYDDRELRLKITSLTSSVTLLKVQVKELTPYDDTELRNEIRAISERPVYDDTAIRQRLTELESRPTGQSYDDTAIRTEIAALKSREDRDTVYDDADIKSRLSALESKTDKDAVYDDSIVNQRLSALEMRSDKDTIYDDSELRRRIDSLEDRPIYDDSQLQNRVTSLENKQDYDDSALVARVEKLETSGSSSHEERFGPTGWFLDRSVSPWQFRFDNGSSLTLGNVDRRAYIYAESVPLTQESASEYRVITTLMRFAMGSNTLVTLGSLNGVARFWGGAIVTNPINDSSGFDFKGALFNPSDTSGPSKRAQATMIRCYYELGVFTKEDITALGAIEL